MNSSQTKEPATSARNVAIEFIRLSQEANSPLTQMQIQKLVYFAHGWHLALKDSQPLIGDTIEAWKWGPVTPSLYRMFRSAGNLKISVSDSVTSNLTEDTADFIKKIWTKYHTLSAGKMSSITHESGTPWHTVVKDHEFKIPSHTPIQNNLIETHFQTLPPLPS